MTALADRDETVADGDALAGILRTGSRKLNILHRFQLIAGVLIRIIIRRCTGRIRSIAAGILIRLIAAGIVIARIACIAAGFRIRFRFSFLLGLAVCLRSRFGIGLAVRFCSRLGFAFGRFGILCVGFIRRRGRFGFVRFLLRIIFFRRSLRTVFHADVCRIGVGAACGQRCRKQHR